MWAGVLIMFSCQASVRALVELNKNSVDKEESTRKKREPRFIQPTVENFRRTKKGASLMEQELRRLVQKQAKKMPSKALLDVDETKITFQFQEKKGTLSVQDLCMKGPQFLDAYFRDYRNKIVFGTKVQTWFAQISAAIDEYQSKPLHELMYLISAFKPSALTGKEMSDEEDGEDDN
jgi:hypothetical protein